MIIKLIATNIILFFMLYFIVTNYIDDEIILALGALMIPALSLIAIWSF